MNHRTMQLLTIALLAAIGATSFALGFLDAIIQPFTALPDKVKLLSLINHAVLVTTPFLMAGIIATGVHQMTHPKRNPQSYGRWWKTIGCTVATACLFAVITRINLEYRINKADYVPCHSESYQSAKTSWRVFASEESLCDRSF